MATFSERGELRNMIKKCLKTVAFAMDNSDAFKGAEGRERLLKLSDKTQALQEELTALLDDYSERLIDEQEAESNKKDFSSLDR